MRISTVLAIAVIFVGTKPNTTPKEHMLNFLLLSSIVLAEGGW